MHVEKEILELLKREGPVTVYRIAKMFGFTYGAAQWYIGKLQQLGFIYTVKIGSKRYVALRDHDLLQKVTVEDAVDELAQALASHGIEPKMALREALERLETKAPHLAEALRLIVQIR